MKPSKTKKKHLQKHERQIAIGEDVADDFIALTAQTGMTPYLIKHVNPKGAMAQIAIGLIPKAQADWLKVQIVECDSVANILAHVALSMTAICNILIEKGVILDHAKSVTDITQVLGILRVLSNDLANVDKPAADPGRN